MTLSTRRPSVSVRLLLTLLLAGLFASSASAQGTTVVKKVRVTAGSDWPQGTFSGYQPVNIELENESDVDRRVYIELYSNFMRMGSVTVQYDLAPFEKLTTIVEVPTFDSPNARSWGHDYSLTASTGGKSGTIYSVCGSSSSGSIARCVMGFSRDRLEAGRQEQMEASINQGLVQQGSHAHQLFSLSTGLFEGMPTNHLAYSSLQAVMLDVSAGLPDREAVDAVLAYVRLGGSLFLFGDVQSGRIQVNPQLAACLEERFLRDHPKITSGSGISCYRAGAGLIFVAHGTSGLPVSDKSMRTIREIIEATPTFVPGPFSRHFPILSIPGVGSLPYYFFVAILVLFAVVIGPVNFALVRKSGKPYMLLLTIPAISIVATLLLVSYGVFSQGIDTKSASVSLTYLDQRFERIDVIENRSLFVGLGTEDGLLPGPGTACFPFIVGEQQRNFRIQTSGEFLLTGSFYESREEMQQLYLSERTSRLRCVIERSGSGFQVTNALSCGVNFFLMRDLQGNAFGYSGRIGPGETVELSSFDENLRANSVEESFGSDFGRSSLGPLVRLMDGTYLAKLEENVFQDDCGLSMSELQGRFGVIGTIDREELR